MIFLTRHFPCNIIQKPLTTQSKSIKMKERSTSNIETNSTIDMNRSSNWQQEDKLNNTKPHTTINMNKAIEFWERSDFPITHESLRAMAKNIKFCPDEMNKKKSYEKTKKRREMKRVWKIYPLEDKKINDAMTKSSMCLTLQALCPVLLLNSIYFIKMKLCNYPFISNFR